MWTDQKLSGRSGEKNLQVEKHHRPGRLWFHPGKGFHKGKGYLVSIVFFIGGEQQYYSSYGQHCS